MSGYTDIYSDTYTADYILTIYPMPGITNPVVYPLEDGTNSVSTVVPSAFNTYLEVKDQAAASWKIVAQGVTSTVAVAFNDKQRVHAVGTFVSHNGIDRPVVYHLDKKAFIPQAAYNIYNRLSTTVSSAWRVIDRRSSQKSVKFDVRISDYAGRAVNFRVLQRVYKPGITLERWTNQLPEPIVKPISYSNSSVNPSSQYKVEQRLFLKEKIAFNDRIPVRVQKSIHFNDLALSVTSTVASSWELKKKVSPTVASDWRLPSRRPAKRAITFDVRNPVTVQKSMHFAAHNKVTSTKASAFKTVGHIRKQLEVRYNTLIRVLPQDNFPQYPVRIDPPMPTSWNVLKRVVKIKRQLTFNSPGNVSGSIVRPIDVNNPASQPKPNYGLGEPVVQPIDPARYAAYGQSASPGITWRLGIDPAGKVTPQCAIAFNDHKKVSPTVACSWKTVGRTSVGATTQWNIYNPVKDQTTVEWIIGPPLSGHIRQTAQNRMDFVY